MRGDSDRNCFDLMEANRDHILQRDKAPLEWVIRESVR